MSEHDLFLKAGSGHGRFILQPREILDKLFFTKQNIFTTLDVLVKKQRSRQSLNENSPPNKRPFSFQQNFSGVIVEL